MLTFFLLKNQFYLKNVEKLDIFYKHFRIFPKDFWFFKISIFIEPPYKSREISDISLNIII